MSGSTNPISSFFRFLGGTEGPAAPDVPPAQPAVEEVVFRGGSSPAGGVARPAGSPGDLPDPALPATAVGGYYAKYKGPLFVEGVSANDIAQGQLGDCFLLAAMSAVAATNPDRVRSHLIADNGDGTYSVRFSEPLPGGRRRDVRVDVDADLPIGAEGVTLAPRDGVPGAAPEGSRLLFGRGTDAGNGESELWPSLVEKAYAQWKGGYGALNEGGYLSDALSAVSGEEVHWSPLSTLSEKDVWTWLKSASDAKKPITTSTYSKGGREITPGLVEGHAYTVLGVSERGGEKFVQLRNTWASTEVGDDGKDDGVFELRFADYTKSFADAAVAGKRWPEPPPSADPWAHLGGGGG